MSGFSAEMAELDDAVEEMLLDPAFHYPDGHAGAPVSCMVVLEHPREAERMGGASFTRSRPVMRVRRSRFPKLRNGALFRIGDKYWSAAEAPQATDDGAWLVFEVQPG